MKVNMLKKSRVGLCRLLEAALILAVLVLVLDVLWGVLTRWSGSFVVWLAERDIEAWAFLPRGTHRPAPYRTRYRNGLRNMPPK